MKKFNLIIKFNEKLITKEIKKEEKKRIASKIYI